MRFRTQMRLLAALALVIFSVVPSLAANLSGTILNNSTKTVGRVYVTLEGWPKGSGISTATPGDFTIRGVQDGRYQLKAYMDSNNDGAFSVSEASAQRDVEISSGQLVSGTTTLTLYNPINPMPQAVSSLRVAPSNGMAYVGWEYPFVENGAIAADSFIIEWSTNGFATIAGSASAGPLWNSDTDEGTFFATGLTNTTYSFRVRSKLGSLSVVSDAVTAQIGPPAGGHTVSGTISFNGFTTSGKPLFVGLWSDTDDDLYFVRYPSATNGMTFSIPGVPDSKRGVFAFIDQNMNNVPDLGDYFYAQPLMVKIAGANLSGVTVPLTASDVNFVTVTTQHVINDGNQQWYHAWLDMESFRKRPINMTISGPQIGIVDASMVDTDVSRNLPQRPNIGDTYTFTVTFLDGSVRSYSSQVTTILDTPPTSLSPSGAISASPATISWQPPAGFAANGVVSANIWGSNFNWESDEYPSTTTSMVYDGPTLPNGAYTLSVQYCDATWNCIARHTGFSVAPVAAVPASVTVPAADADGVYSVSWVASATAGVSYQLQEATNSSFTVGVRTLDLGTALSASITGRSQNLTYYYRVRAIKSGYTPSAYRTALNGCAVPGRATVATPASILVPVADADGVYSVSWGASATAGVTYQLEEAANFNFTTALRTVYTGTALSAAITGRSQNVTYHYRVIASKTGMNNSAYRTGANGCPVPGTATAATPAGIVVPVADADGSYTVSWGASATVGAAYVLHEATNSAFTAGLRTVYAGTALSAAITGRSQNLTYYYRIFAVKAGLRNSAYRTGATGCAVPGTATVATPAGIVVPVTDADGSYSVSWGASATTGVTYLLQEATNSAFTTGLRSVYSGTALSAAISGRLQNVTYFYRVTASKPGMKNSLYRIGATGCAVPGSLTVATPTSIAVPAADADGSYSVSWGASATALVTYQLQEATNSTFTTGLRTVYAGTALSSAIIGRSQNLTYYYRVIASKPGYRNSAYRTGANGCNVQPPYSSADLAGTWYSAGIKTPVKNTSNPLDFGYDVDKMVLAADGSGTATPISTSDSSAPETLPAGSFTISSSGRISPEDPDYLSYMNAGKDVNVSFRQDTAEGEQQLFIDLKKAASYSSTDLAGTWYSAGVKTPVKGTDDAADFGYDVDQMVLNADGSGTATSISSSDSMSTDDLPAGTITITSAGVISTGDPNDYFYMNAGKDVMYQFRIDPLGGEQQLFVNVKKASAYSAADLAGTWYRGGIRTPLKNTFGSEDFGYHVDKVVYNVDGSGTITPVSSSDPASTAVFPAGSFAVNSTGYVSTPDLDDYCYMNAGKNVMVQFRKNTAAGQQQLFMYVKMR